MKPFRTKKFAENLLIFTDLCYNKEADGSGRCSMRFELKKWEMAFANSLAESANDVRIVSWLNEGFPNPYSLQDAEWFIGNVLSDGKAYHRAIVSDKKVIGGISAACKRGAMRFCADLGYWLAPDFWNKGLMTTAVGLFCEEMFSSSDVNRIQAEVFVPNVASCRVLEKCGFQKEGVLRQSVFKNGQFYDAAVYGLLASERGET